MKKASISIIICTINVKTVERLLLSLIGKLQVDDEVIVIVDGKEYLTCDETVTELVSANNWRLIVNEHNQGLSYSRNLGIGEIKNTYCIFFDDDTKITHLTIEKYRKHFESGIDMVGGLLKLPEEYEPLPKWFPDGMSSLIGIHTFQHKIWGANFGFNATFAIDNQICFQNDLGRKGRGLQSGDDTTFVKQYCEINNKSIFDPEIIVYHYINKDRYKLKYLLRRSYWQGISEVCRKSFRLGLKKEINRAFKIDFKNNKLYILPKLMASFSFIISFLVGALVQKCKQISIKE